MRPSTGSCGLASGSRKNALPASRGAGSVEMPSAIRAPRSARPVGVEGSAIRGSLIEFSPQGAFASREKQRSLTLRANRAARYDPTDGEQPMHGHTGDDAAAAGPRLAFHAK